MFRLLKKLIFIFLIVFVLLFAFQRYDERQNVSAGYSPGDALYFLDKSWEWTQYNLLTFTEEGKIKLKIRFIDERVAELEELQRKKELTVERVEQISEDYNNLVSSVDEDLKRMQEAKESVDEFLEKIESLSGKHEDTIKRISGEAPNKTDELFKRLKGFGEDLYQKSEEVFN